jgi:CrcB protein
MKNFLFVFLGGGMGSMLRYACTLIFPTHHYPWATLGVNMAGSFLIGLIMTLIDTSLKSNSSLQLLLVAGFCGGFTTFSAFSLESFRMLQQQQYGLLATYIAVSLIVCIGFTGLGYITGLR